MGSCGGISTLASYGCRNRTVFHTGIVAAGFCLFLGFQPHWLNQIYDLQGSANLANWQTLAANVVSPYLLHPHAAGMPAASFYPRLRCRLAPQHRSLRRGRGHTYAYHPDSDLVQTLTQAHSKAVRLTTTKLNDKLGRLQSITSVPSADSPVKHTRR